MLKARVEAPAAGKPPAAIPWLLLEVNSRAGRGLFEKVTYIQRRNTVGGSAPAQGCEKFHSGVETRVPYRADYFFYGLAQ